MRLTALRIQAALAALVAFLVVLQVYFIASHFFGADDALDLHETNGFAIIHPLEVVVFLVGLAAWWRRWGMVGVSFLLPLIGTIQIGLTEGSDWVGGLHGLLALVVGGLGGHIAAKALLEARRETRGRDSVGVGSAS